jgi:hypothetical protein
MTKTTRTRTERDAKNHEEAVATFAANCEEIRRLADCLVEAAEDHFCLHPDKVNWANVGDTNRILGDLRNILAYATPNYRSNA